MPLANCLLNEDAAHLVEVLGLSTLLDNTTDRRIDASTGGLSVPSYTVE
jgi:hypothetical protein